MTYNKGHIPWNKGKPHMRGKKHPMFGVHRKAEKSPNWKGGKIKHQRGYILIYSPSHPFCTKQGYIFEHRLAMERYLGRPLLKSEIIHHINGNISDNRLENLMLFSNQKEHLGKHKADRRKKEDE